MASKGNRSQRELERLQQQTHRYEQQGKDVQKVSDARYKNAVSRRSLDRDDDGIANFGTPEAVATAVGASFLLGPVGGILLGVAQGILGKDMRQNALDEFNAEQDALTDAAGVFKQNLDNLRVTATNDEDLEQLSGYQAKADAGLRMMQSGIPKLEEQGAQLYGEAFTEVTAYTERQEVQQIAAATKEAQRRTDLDNEQFSRHSGLLNDYDAQSANYETIVQGSANAKQMIERGNPVDIVAALIQVNKALDPTSVVRPEEAKALGNVGTLLDRGITMLNEAAGTGQALSITQREELMTLVTGIEDTARGFQMQRDIRFQERAVDAELPTKYINDFRRVDDLPAFKPGGLQQRDKQSDVVTEPVTDVIEAGASQVDRTSMAINDVIDLAANAPAAIRNWYSGSGREARRQKRAAARELPTN